MASPARIEPLVAGNWKMNGLTASLAEARRVRDRLGEAGFAPSVAAMICPPATLVAALAKEAAGSRLKVGAQDCHAAASGAHTGDISAEMLKDVGAEAVIVGHSERRADHGERSADVKAKVLAARRAGLAAIVCVGETAGERRSGLTLAVVGRQLAASVPDGATARDTIIAYEPVWAIGTGLTAKPADVAEVHAFLRKALSERFAAEGQTMRLLYGGSVKPDNARELMGVANVNGALVGGASLKADDFLAIIAACGA
ncbi:MAG: triose-phosphate isomerase [Hyphomicrobiaceae bacterium]|nr:MAG: triose-phosphate isomerase [Hyphomicrobiaceae bacterium]